MALARAAKYSGRRRRARRCDGGVKCDLHHKKTLTRSSHWPRALLRRSHEQVSAQLCIGHICLDVSTRAVTLAGQHVSLTPKEFSLLEFLLYNRNRAVSRFNMAEHVWGDAFDPFTMSNNIDVHIKNLRKKLDDQAGNIIVTVRGVGYMARDPQP